MTRRSPRHPRRRNQRGAVLVEAALVIPVLIVFILFQRWITEGIATTGL